MNSNQKKQRKKPRKAVKRKKSEKKQMRITQFLLPVEQKSKKEKLLIRNQRLKKRKCPFKNDEDKITLQSGELYFSADKRRIAKIDFKIIFLSRYLNPCFKLLIKDNRK